MHLRTLLSSLALSTPLALLAQTNLVNPDFQAGLSSWETTTLLRTSVQAQPNNFDPPNFTAVTQTIPFVGTITLAAAQTTPAFGGDGSSTAAVIYTNARGVTTLGTGAVLSQSFTVPDQVKNARFSFDYAYATNQAFSNNIISGSLNYLQVAVLIGDYAPGDIISAILAAVDPVSVIFQTQPGDPLVSTNFTTLPQFDLTALFQENAGQQLTLAFITSLGTFNGNRYLNFAIDNILFSINDPSGGGSGTAAAAAPANRRAQQQMQAAQARIARQKVAQQHRRNQQR